MHRIHRVSVLESPMEIFVFHPEGEGPHPGIVLAQHLPVGHTGNAGSSPAGVTNKINNLDIREFFRTENIRKRHCRTLLFGWRTIAD